MVPDRGKHHCRFTGNPDLSALTRRLARLEAENAALKREREDYCALEIGKAEVDALRAELANACTEAGRWRDDFDRVYADLAVANGRLAAVVQERDEAELEAARGQAGSSGEDAWVRIAAENAKDAAARESALRAENERLREEVAARVRQLQEQTRIDTDAIREWKAERDALRADLARAQQERDSYRHTAEQKWALRQEVEELLGVPHDAASDEQFRLGVEALRQMKADLAVANGRLAAVVQERDEAEAEEAAVRADLAALLKAAGSAHIEVAITAISGYRRDLALARAVLESAEDIEDHEDRSVIEVDRAAWLAWRAAKEKT